MASDGIVWPEDGAPQGIKNWVKVFFTAADQEGDDAAKSFTSGFAEDATMSGMAAPIHGKQAIYESRLKAWDTVEKRKHTIFKVYTNKKDFSDVLLLGKLDSTMKNGRSFEMEFAAQILFEGSNSDNPKATDYTVWADKQIAMKAASGQ